MLLVHANDMLDQRVIDSGNFIAHPTIGNPAETITDTVAIISQTIEDKDLRIVCDKMT